MNVIEHVERALARGRSPFSLGDVLRWNAQGLVSWYQGKRMTASAIERGGKFEILHVAGEWNGEDAAAMWRQYEEDAKRRGLEVHYQGRRGWRRFLRMRGFDK